MSQLCQYRVAVVETVKSERMSGTKTRFGRHFWGLGGGLGGLVLCGILLPRPAGAQSVLLGPAVQRVRPNPELDPLLPKGPLRLGNIATLPVSHLRCSSFYPVCVAEDYQGRIVKGDPLPTLERAYRTFVVAMGLPAPTGWASSPTVWVLEEGGADARVELKEELLSTWDAAQVVCHSGVLGDWEQNAHLCVAEAILAHLDPAESRLTRRAYAYHLWWGVALPTEPDLRLLSAAGRTPSASIFEEPENPAPAALFFSYLDDALGTSNSAEVTTGLFAISGQRTPPGSVRFENEPDLFDALRATTDDDLSELARLLRSYAVSRILPYRSSRMNHSFRAPAMAAVPLPDWTIAASSLPRRVAFRKPLGPLGFSYLSIELDVPTTNLELGLVLDWEPPSPFTWTVVKVDAQGTELGRSEIAFEPRVTHAEKNLVSLEGTRTLLVVGTNLGGIDLAHPFDPDYAPFEPHGATAYIVKQ
jgi:hypothetical protein